MSRHTLKVLAAAGFLASVSTGPARPAPAGDPPIILGGEVYNSSASSPDYLAALWPRFEALNLNTVLLPVEWDQIEPREGRFDFTPVDAVVAQARAHKMRLGLIWFGAFKNGRSTYAPSWVRADGARFPRAQTRKPLAPTGASATTSPPAVSVFGKALAAADARAFAALMAHVAAVDTDRRVVLVQVENEVGLIGDSRDRSLLAEAAWRSPVPAALIEQVRSHPATIAPALRAGWEAQGRPGQGDWAQVFGEGPSTDEAFMAWAFSRYVEQIARAGRPFSRAPFYANAWLGPEPGEPLPGDYPSGGPTAGMIDVWKLGAPSLAFVSPDIYVEDVKGAQGAYDRPDNQLFVPEARPRPGDLFWALGRHKARGWSAFGVDDLRPTSEVAKAYAVLGPMTEVIARAQAQDRIAGVLLEGDETQVVELGGLTLTFRDADAFWRRQALDAGQRPTPPPPAGPSETDDFDTRPDARAFGLVIAEGPGQFLFVGRGLLVDATRDGRPVEVDRVEEGAYRDGRWVPGRLINGDDYAAVVPRDEIGARRVSFLPGAVSPR